MPDNKKIVPAWWFVFIRGLIIIFGIFYYQDAYSQEVAEKDTVAAHVTDATDVIKKILGKKKDTAQAKTTKSVAILPSIGYNPSLGFVFGAKASVIRQFGESSNTDLSTFGLEFSY